MTLRRWIWLALAAAAQAALSAQQPLAGRPPQADDIARVIAELSRVLSSGQPEDLRALTAPSLTSADAAVIDREFQKQGQRATLRERARVPEADGFDVLTDVFLGRGREAKIATWRLSLRPKPGGADRYAIAAVQEQASLNGLIKLAIDDRKQFVIHDLAVRCTDFTLRMTSGIAFVAESAEGITALVLHGNGQLEFSPPDPAEQAQLRVVSGRPALRLGVDSAFVRVNPKEFASQISGLPVASTTVDAVELAHAHEIFSRLAPESFSVDLHDIGEEGWSLTPGPSNIVVEAKAKGLGWLTYTRAPTDPEDITLVSRTSGHVLSSYASPERLASRGPIFDEDAGRPYDIERYGLDISFDPARFQVTGRATLLVKMIADRATSLNFRLDDALTVSSVSTPGFGRLLAIRVMGQDKILVSLPGALSKGAEVVIEVEYSGRLAPPPLDREAMTFDGIPQVDQTPVEPFHPDPEPLLIYSGHLAWYPQAFVNDYATGTMRLTVPAEFGIAASGTRTNSSMGSTDDPAKAGATRPTRSVEFTASRPIRYFGCVIGRLLPAGQARAEVPHVSAADDRTNTAPKDAGIVNVEALATPREVNASKQIASRASEILQFYAKLVGEAPYPDLTVAVADDNIPGGHSPAFLTILRQPLTTTPFDWRSDVVAFHDYPNFMLAHEIAHQWWGQAVGWQNYHEQWLSEGLSQYFALLYAGSSLGDEQLRKILGVMKTSAMSASVRGPIALGYRLGHLENDGRTFRTIVYNKSAVVLDMLRRLIGDDAFYAGLRRYYRDHRFEKAGTQDLRAAFEAETPMRLRRFFDGWIDTPGIPHLKASVRLDASGKTALVHVEQTGPVFDLPLTIAVEYADGHTEDVTVAVTNAVVDRQIVLKSVAKRVSVRDEGTLAIING